MGKSDVLFFLCWLQFTKTCTLPLPDLIHISYMFRSGSLSISPPKVLPSSCRPFHVQEKWIIRALHYQSTDLVGSQIFWDCSYCELMCFRHQTKILAGIQMLYSVPQFSRVILAQHPLTRGPRSDF